MKYTTSVCPRCAACLVNHIPSYKAEEILGAEYVMCPKCLTLIRTQSGIQQKSKDFESLSTEKIRRRYYQSKIISVVSGILLAAVFFPITYFLFHIDSGLVVKLIFCGFTLLFGITGLAMIYNGFTKSQPAWEQEMRDKLDENKYIVKYWEYHDLADKQLLKTLKIDNWCDFFKLEKKTLKNIPDKIKYGPLNYRIETLSKSLANAKTHFH